MEFTHGYPSHVCRKHFHLNWQRYEIQSKCAAVSWTFAICERCRIRLYQHLILYRPAQTDVKSSVVAALRLSGIEVILVSNRVADGKSR